MIHADNRRVTARVVLFILVAVTMTLVLFAGGPTGAVSFAQQQTTSPGPSIKWLNPDAETSNEISGQADRSGAPTGQTYHLVATVNQVPPNPVVTFLYRQGTGQPEQICEATQVGDAFHCHWAVANMPADGSYTLIALLSSNAQQLAQDTEPVVVNNTTEGPPNNVDPTTAQSETVEIVDPGLGEMHGFYDRPGDPRYTAVIRVSYSDGTTELLPYYTTSAPGTEPEWVECESGSQSVDDSDDGVQCELASPTVPTQVTGVAVVAYDDPTAPAPVPGPDQESGDAHRIHGYEAIPTSFSLIGATSSVPSGTCSPVITATLFDQHGNTIGGANVDVHGQGPSDALQFDDSVGTANNSSAHKPPENHPTQNARDCESTSTPPAQGGSQGWHAETGNDRKHIESTDGTADDGTFKFQFFSPVNGVTQYTIWSDDDGNDRLCSQEAQKDGAVGWGQAPPATPTGAADEDATCVRPGQSSTTAMSTSPSTGGSTSPNPTVSSTSPSPTASSTSPSPTSTSPSPTSTTSPSPTTTTTPPPDDMPIPVASSVSGKATKKGFNGQVTAAKKRCEKRRLVKVKKAGKGVIGKDRTNRAGNWKLRRPNAKGRFHAVVMPKKYTNKNGQTFKCTKDRSPFFRRNG